jgi:PIN domain nuclease of toxin-antitoxin system
MNLLLDTHAVLWFLMGNRHLSVRARGAIESGRNRVFVSAVSGYELTYKNRRSKLQFPFGRDFAVAVCDANFCIISITLEHAIDAGQLGGLHGDPWDRVLIAQARADDLIVVTRDQVFEDYGVRTLW